jgi:hypothetical protein
MAPSRRRLLVGSAAAAAVGATSLGHATAASFRSGSSYSKVVAETRPTREQIIANTKPIVANHSSVTLTLLALLSAAIAMGVLAVVVRLFQSEGIPLARLAAAERACIQHAFISERETCMREWLAASRRPSVAKK